MGEGDLSATSNLAKIEEEMVVKETTKTSVTIKRAIALSFKSDITYSWNSLGRATPQ